MHNVYRIIHILIATLACNTVIHAATPAKPRVNFSTTYSHDNRDYNTFSVLIASNRLPYGLSLWGFTDIHGAQESSGQRADAVRSFSEYRLSYNNLGNTIGLPGLGLQAEYNDATPGNNNLARLGLTYKWHFSSNWLQLRAFPIESDNDGGQLSLIYSFKFSERISLGGFADYNIRENQSNEWVIKPQFRLGFAEQFQWVLEYRYNGFEDSNPNLDGSGVATGLRINF